MVSKLGIEEVSESDLKNLVCYPFVTDRCLGILTRLRDLGAKVLSAGRSCLGKYRVLGKGHSSIILAGAYEGNLVAIKVIRQDSKRDSLRIEGEILRRLSNYGITPKVFYFDDDIIIMEIIEGPTLTQLFNECIAELTYKDRELATKLVKVLVKELLMKAFLMDKLGIIHKELSKPGKHVLINCKRGRAVFIDFESVTLGGKGSNLTALASGLILRGSTTSLIVRDLLGIDDIKVSLLKAELSRYKKSLGERKAIIEKVMRFLELTSV